MELLRQVVNTTSLIVFIIGVIVISVLKDVKSVNFVIAFLTMLILSLTTPLAAEAIPSKKRAREIPLGSYLTIVAGGIYFESIVIIAMMYMTNIWKLLAVAGYIIIFLVSWIMKTYREM